jgi:hypothetical protein
MLDQVPAEHELRLQEKLKQHPELLPLDDLGLVVLPSLSGAAARANYLKQVCDVDEESPTDYDVVINTERLTQDAAVGLILGLVQARPAPSRPTAAPVRASGG